MNRVEHHVGAPAVFEELRHTPGCHRELAHGARSHVEEYFALDCNVLLLRSLFPKEAA